MSMKMYPTLDGKSNEAVDFLESYLNPDNGYKSPEELYAELRYRVISALGKQTLAEQFIEQLENETEVGGKLIVTRSWAGWILQRAHTRHGRDRCAFCGARDGACSH